MMSLGNTLVVVANDGGVYGADVVNRVVQPVFQFGGAKIGFNPQDRFMMSLGNTLVVVTNDGSVYGADVVGSGSGRFLAPVQRFGGAKIGFNQQDRFMVSLGKTLVVITSGGHVFGSEVKSTPTGASLGIAAGGQHKPLGPISERELLPVFEFDGARIGFNPEDRFMMSLGNTFVVVTGDGDVFGSEVTGRSLSPVGVHAITVDLINVICRDTESIHSSDKFALAGSIFTGQENQGVYFPTMRINDHEERNLGRSYHFISDLPSVGISLMGWDLDENDSWKENEADIKKGVGAIALAVAAVPGWGTTASAVISGVSKAVIDTIDQFNEWDKNDKLLDYNEVVTLTADVPNVDNWINHPIDFSHGDFSGYSSWDYTITMRINCRWQPTLS